MEKNINKTSNRSAINLREKRNGITMIALVITIIVV